MVATGLRIGEALAVTWADVDPAEGAVTVRGTVLRIKGSGLIIKHSPKSAAGSGPPAAGVGGHYDAKESCRRWTRPDPKGEAGLSARSAADQLGHAKPSMTTDVYYGRKTRATGAAVALEALDL